MFENHLLKIKSALSASFQSTDSWFASEAELMDYRPNDGGWSIREILEHITLTNYYLLILIRKGTLKSIEKAGTLDYTAMLSTYEINMDKLSDIGRHKLFDWHRPDHMEPKGNGDLLSLQHKMNNQLAECYGYLNMLQNGEGILYRTMMSVNNLGKIDVYHYILFLAEHINRHIVQMEKIKKEYEREEKK